MLSEVNGMNAAWMRVFLVWIPLLLFVLVYSGALRRIKFFVVDAMVYFGDKLSERYYSVCSNCHEMYRKPERKSVPTNDELCPGCALVLSGGHKMPSAGPGSGITGSMRPIPPFWGFCIHPERPIVGRSKIYPSMQMCQECVDDEAITLGLPFEQRE